MSMEWETLAGEERAAFWVAADFLEGRLSDSATVEWALTLGHRRRAERLAVAHVLRKQRAMTVGEPWSSIWGLIEQSWAREPVEQTSSMVYEIEGRLSGGDRSGALVAMIGRLVAPRIEVSLVDPAYRREREVPETTGDLVRGSLTSGRLVTPKDIGLGQVVEIPFLTDLAHALEAEVREGMAAGRRVGWDGSGLRVWWLGFLYHVKFDEEAEDADMFHKGIAPSVKLLYAVVARIAELELEAALPIVRGWGLLRTPIEVRLWAGIAADRSMVSAEEVEGFLAGLSDRQFWDVHSYPEITTLRAERFGDLSRKGQDLLVERIRQLPPPSHWPATLDAAELEGARAYNGGARDEEARSVWGASAE